MKTNENRRSALKTVATTALAAPILMLSKEAFAATNDALRTALKYQDTPQDGNHCSICMHWKPGATAEAEGGCAILPGDDEISPNGWCSAYVKKP